MNLYTDIDAACCRYLERLVDLGLIPPGEVMQADIRDIEAADLAGCVQVHAFCGIGGWPYALGLAGWPADRPCWTASLPCQPFSSAGRRLAERDARHLWPAFRCLVAECRPSVCFGEQVASKAGRRWLAGVRLDLESLGYAVGAADLPAACVGAPHWRQRLWWVADAAGARCSGREDTGSSGSGAEANACGGIQSERGGATGGVADADACRWSRECWPGQAGTSEHRPPGGLADADGTGLPPSEREGVQRPGRRGEGGTVGQPGRSFWADFNVVACRDGKARRVEPGVFPLAARLPGRVAAIRGYGNAIVPQVAAEFVKAYMECFSDA